MGTPAAPSIPLLTVRPQSEWSRRGFVQCRLHDSTALCRGSVVVSVAGARVSLSANDPLKPANTQPQHCLPFPECSNYPSVCWCHENAPCGRWEWQGAQSSTRPPSTFRACFEAPGMVRNESRHCRSRTPPCPWELTLRGRYGGNPTSVWA